LSKVLNRRRPALLLAAVAVLSYAPILALLRMKIARDAPA
jgi:hypothetical protein